MWKTICDTSEYDFFGEDAHMINTSNIDDMLMEIKGDDASIYFKRVKAVSGLMGFKIAII